MDHRLLLALLFSACVLGCLIILLTGLRIVLKHSLLSPERQKTFFRRTAVLLTIWILLLGGLSLSGWFAEFSALPPRIPLALLLPLPFVLAVSFSPAGKLLLGVLPPHWLIYFQSFRIVVELLLWMAVLFTLLPVQMSFEGRNFDVVAGLLTLPVAYYCYVKKTWSSVVALVYNIAGLLLLLNIVLIAVWSMPLPIRRFYNTPDSSLLVRFPFIFLPGFLVPLAYSLHIFSIRQWVLDRRMKMVGMSV